MQNIRIKNEYLEIEISPLGAEIQKIIDKNGKTLLHDGKNFWQGKAPVLFPICGSVKNDRYTVCGIEYTMQKHGFARDSVFKCEDASSDSVTFVLRHDEKTLKIYPFEFELSIKYTVSGAELKVESVVKNLGNKEMYFSIGAHEGLKCDGGINDTKIVFEKKETLFNCEVAPNIGLMTGNSERICENTDTLHLCEDWFKIDALVFKTLKSRYLRVVNKATGRTVKVNFDGFDSLLIWTMPGADFVCAEPWCGFPDDVDFEGDFSEKYGIIQLLPGEEKTKAHSLEFEHLK